MTPAPTERVTPLRAALHERALAGVLAGACLGVLVLAAWLSPDPRGHATHETLGLAPCAWAVWFDKPCPTCGMTTAYAHAAEGSLIDAARAQPMGAILAVLTAAIFWGATHQAIAGSRIGSSVQGWIRPKWLILVFALASAAWIYKIATWT